MGKHVLFNYYRGRSLKGVQLCYASFIKLRVVSNYNYPFFLLQNTFAFCKVCQGCWSEPGSF